MQIAFQNTFPTKIPSIVALFNFPSIRKFSVFQRNNPDIALHCFALDSPDGRDVHHYLWVKNLSRLVMNRH